jgi:hypothetical protein
MELAPNRIFAGIYISSVEISGSAAIELVMSVFVSLVSAGAAASTLRHTAF